MKNSSFILFNVNVKTFVYEKIKLFPTFVMIVEVQKTC